MKNTTTTNTTTKANTTTNRKEERTMKKATAEQIEKAMKTNAIYSTIAEKAFSFIEKETEPEEKERENTFRKAMRAYEKESTFENGYALSVYIVRAVLRKLADPSAWNATKVRKEEDVDNSGFSPVVKAMIASINRDLSVLANIADCNENAFCTGYDVNGNIVRKVNSKRHADGLTAIQSETLSDAYDLVQEAYMALLEMTRDRKEECSLRDADWLEVPFFEHSFDKRVRINRMDSHADIIEHPISPISYVFRSVRSCFEKSRHLQIANGKYCYIEDLFTADGERAESYDGAEIALYSRLPKYADLGGYETDIYGRSCGQYSVGSAEAENFFALFEKLELNERQKKIVELRMQGYGKKAIGTYLGIDPANVARCLKQVQEKAIKAGYKAPNAD